MLLLAKACVGGLEQQVTVFLRFWMPNTVSMSQTSSISINSSDT